MFYLEQNKKNEINYDNENILNEPNINKVFFKKYRVLEKISEGSFGSIYKGICLKTKSLIAIKLEDRSQSNILEKEGYNLVTLKGFGIVELISFGRSNQYNIMIMPLLGDSIYKIFLDCNKIFTLKDVCLIGLQCLDRIEWIHTKNFIHRDVKPENFLLGRKDPRIIYMIDFGLSKKYRSERTMKHIQFSLTKKLAGTARYASVNALKGFELSRRDDLESFCYMLLFFTLKKLPWQGIKAKTLPRRYKKICNIKELFNIDEYKNIVPLEIIKIFKYVKKLKFDEEPNYDKIRDLFKNLLNKLGYNENETFSWIKDKRILVLKKSHDIHKRKISYRKRIFESLKKNGNLITSKDNINNIFINNIKNNQKFPNRHNKTINYAKNKTNNSLFKKSNFEENLLNNTNNEKEIQNNDLTCTQRKANLDFNLELSNSKINSFNKNLNQSLKIENKAPKIMNSIKNGIKKIPTNNLSYINRTQFISRMANKNENKKLKCVHNNTQYLKFDYLNHLEKNRFTKNNLNNKKFKEYTPKNVNIYSLKINKGENILQNLKTRINKGNMYTIYKSNLIRKYKSLYLNYEKYPFNNDNQINYKSILSIIPDI